MDFHFSLTQAEKDFLHDLVRLSIRSRFEPGTRLPAPISQAMEDRCGAFVTLKRKGRLRGCIGHIVGDKPLHRTVAEMARAAAFNDPRFPPVSAGELPDLDVEISILSPLSGCTPEEVQPGRHGLLVRRGRNSGLLLPQVAREYGWDRETFLAQTCLKAGLPRGAWQNPAAEIFCFEAEVF